MSFFFYVVTNKIIVILGQSELTLAVAFSGYELLRWSIYQKKWGCRLVRFWLQLSWFLYETGAAAVSLYFLIQVLGCQLGLAQIKDLHPQSVLSSHQWHAPVLAPLLPPHLSHISLFIPPVFKWPAPKFLVWFILCPFRAYLLWQMGVCRRWQGLVFHDPEPMQPLLVILTERPEVITKNKTCWKWDRSCIDRK